MEKTQPLLKQNKHVHHEYESAGCTNITLHRAMVSPGFVFSRETVPTYAPVLKQFPLPPSLTNSYSFWPLHESIGRNTNSIINRSSTQVPKEKPRASEIA